MNNILLTASYITCFLSLLCLFIIILQNKFRLYPKLLICLSILFCLFVISLWTTFQGVVPLKKHAYLWVFSFPLYYLPGTTLYLYVKAVLKKNKAFNYWDLLHFLPFVINLIVILPYAMLPSSTKLELLEEYILLSGKKEINAFMMINSTFEFYSKIISWLTYAILTLVLLYKFKIKNKVWIKTNKPLWNWINRSTLINIISMLIHFYFIFGNFEFLTFTKLIVIPSIFFMLTCVITLMFNPAVFYGFKSKGDQSDGEFEEKLYKTFELSPEKINEYKLKINQLVLDKKIYLIKNYSIKDMSGDLDIPIHHLSFVINKELGTNYTSFINKCRIDYIIANRNNPQWSNFSLEGIGTEAGFNSRNTFFKAFKLATGKTPSDYFKNKDNSVHEN